MLAANLYEFASAKIYHAHERHRQAAGYAAMLARYRAHPDIGRKGQPRPGAE